MQTTELKHEQNLRTTYSKSNRKYLLHKRKGLHMIIYQLKLYFCTAERFGFAGVSLVSMNFLSVGVVLFKRGDKPFSFWNKPVFFP